MFFVAAAPPLPCTPPADHRPRTGTEFSNRSQKSDRLIVFEVLYIVSEDYPVPRSLLSRGSRSVFFYYSRVHGARPRGCLFVSPVVLPLALLRPPHPLDRFCFLFARCFSSGLLSVLIGDPTLWRIDTLPAGTSGPINDVGVGRLFECDLSRRLQPARF